MFYILYESVQIVVTASSLGIPVPQMLVDLLETLKINLSANRNFSLFEGHNKAQSVGRTFRQKLSQKLYELVCIQNLTACWVSLIF